MSDASGAEGGRSGGPSSMTGFAAAEGRAMRDGVDLGAWRWEARSVNSKGLDWRVRGPAGFDATDGRLRAAAEARFARGAVTATLTLTPAERPSGLRLSPTGLEDALRALAEVTTAADAAGVALTTPSAADVLSVRGVVESDAAATDAGASEALAAAATDGLAALLDGLSAERRSEGARLAAVLRARLDDIATLVDEAEAQAATRIAPLRARIAERVAELAPEAGPVDPARLAQEVALLAQKADVSEEIDRLRSHVARARELLDKAEPIGRTLEFLSQEFNREANTLCAKSGDAALTEIGVALKVAVDQVREQAANIE